MTTLLADITRKGAALLMLTFPLLLAGTVLAAPATRIWIGKEDPFWSNPGNWTNGLVPVSGDSIEFLDDVKFRDTYNDLDPEMSLGSLHIKGRNYVLRGNKINLQDNIVSQPSNSSNLITLSLNINSPLSIINYGYFNVLELSGQITLYWHPLVLETSSLIRLSGLILDTNNVGVIQRASGTVSFAPTGRVAGTIVVESGEMLFAGASANPHLYGVYKSELIVGTDSDPPGSARVVWGADNRLTADTRVTVNRSGRLDLNSYSQTAATLSGMGVVDLNAGQWNIQGPDRSSSFGGNIRGNGTLRLMGVEAGFELNGHSTFTGAVEVASLKVTNGLPPVVSTYHSRFNLAGSVSNAITQLLPNSTLRGAGATRSLTASNAVVQPGPGVLRLLEYFSMDSGSTLEIVLDGPGAGAIQAGSIDLGGAALDLSHLGFGPANLFTLIAANQNTGSTFKGLPEGAWIVAGEAPSPSEFRVTYAGNAGADVLLERTGPFVPPTLRIRRSGPGNAIEWPVSAQGYTLEYSPTLGPAAWTGDGLPMPDATATEFFIIDPGGDGRRFYRLVR